MRGQTDDLKQRLLESFKEKPNGPALFAYWQFSNEQEKREMAEYVLDLVQRHSAVEESIQMLLYIEETYKAANLLVNQYNQITNVNYGLLLDWVESFEQANHTMAQIVCYRMLLDDILDRGQSKAYHHGAEYFHKLLALDSKHPDYGKLVDAQAFIQGLQEKHGRKRSFWDKAHYSNKPN